MRLLVVTLALILFGFVAPAAPASAAMIDDCAHAATILSLRTCVQHALDHGHIDSRSIARSLFAQLDAAQAALDRGQTSVAVRKLEAFVRELDAQTGKHIVAEHATHLRMHAEAVITALRG
jgi:hypothetical protein